MIENAETAVSTGNSDDGIDYLRAVLALHPEHDDARIFLSDLLKSKLFTSYNSMERSTFLKIWNEWKQVHPARTGSPFFELTLDIPARAISSVQPLLDLVSPQPQVHTASRFQGQGIMFRVHGKLSEVSLFIFARLLFELIEDNEPADIISGGISSVIDRQVDVANLLQRILNDHGRIQ